MEYQQLLNRKQKAVDCLNRIALKLQTYVSSQNFIAFDLDKSKQSLLVFLDKYGMSTFNGDIEKHIASIPKFDHINKLVGRFIIEESKTGSPVFNDIVTIIKGNFVAKAIFFDNNAGSDFNEKLKDVTLILDAPVMLKLLGLKDTGANNAATELTRLLPKKIKLRYFPENLDELESIIRSYIHGLSGGRNSALTLEYFDENIYSAEDVESYYATLRQRLRNISVDEFENDIEFKQEYCIDCEGLKDFLHERMVYNKEKALENDVDSIMKIRFLRKGISPKSFIDCKYIFVTSNTNLCFYAKTFLKENGLGSVITDTDLTVLLWMLGEKPNSSTPKDLLLANAFSAVDEVSDAFIYKAVEKFNNYSKDKNFNAALPALMYENIFLRRDISNICLDDPDLLSEDKIISITEKYKKELLGEEFSENKLLKQENERLKQENKAQKDSIKERTKRAKVIASNKAGIKYARVYCACKIAVYLLLFICFATGLTGTILNAIRQPQDVWAYIVLALAVLAGISTLFKNAYEKVNILFRLARKIANRAKNAEYDKVYAKNIFDNDMFSE